MVEAGEKAFKETAANLRKDHITPQKKLVFKMPQKEKLVFKMPESAR